MNFKSSMANTLVGSVIAIVSVAPARDSGTIWYFSAVSAGTRLTTAGLISNWGRAIGRQPHYLVLQCGFGGNQLDDRGIDLKLGECNGRHAVLLAEERRDLLVLDVPELDQVVPEFSPVLALIVQRLLELLGRDALLLEKKLTDAYGHRLSLKTHSRTETPSALRL